MQAMLVFENAPPFTAPLRFFLTAPLFGVLAGLLLLVDGPEVFASRWTPGALAATHLISIGFMLQVMLGALIQILPVVAGASLERPVRVARMVHAGLTLGTLLLAAGFLGGEPVLLGSAAAVLGLSVLHFLVVTLRALWRVPATSPTIHGIKLAMAGLAGTVALGVVMALALAEGWSIPLIALADLHAGWGLAAWGGVLLAALAYVVVPMFQLTPAYPARPSWWFPRLMLAATLLWSLGVLADWPLLVRLGQIAAALAGMAFASLSLRLQCQRRRARPDATYRYWQLGLILFNFGLFFLLTVTIGLGANFEGGALFIGILLVLGGFVSLIVGMLYKIVPFLAWMHLQACAEGKIAAPAMHRILAEPAMHRQFLAYVVALLLLLLAVFFPEALARPAGLAFALANGGLFWNLAGAVRRYRQHRTDIELRLASGPASA